MDISQYISLPAGSQQFPDELPDWSPMTGNVWDAKEDADPSSKEWMIEREKNSTT